MVGNCYQQFPCWQDCFQRPSRWLAERAEPGFSHSRGHLLRLRLLPGLSEEYPSYSCCHLPVECHSLCPLILTSVTIGCRGSSMCLNSSVIRISCPIEPPLLQTMSCGLSRHSWHTVSGKGLPAEGRSKNLLPAGLRAIFFLCYPSPPPHNSVLQVLQRISSVLTLWMA